MTEKKKKKKIESAFSSGLLKYKIQFLSCKIISLNYISIIRLYNIYIVYKKNFV